MSHNPENLESTSTNSADGDLGSEAKASASHGETGSAAGSYSQAAPEAEATPADATAEATPPASDSEARSEATGDDADPEAATDAEDPAQAKIDELTADLKRVSAEFANYRKRAERDRQATIQLAKGQVASDLLPMADDLQLADQHGDLEDGPLKAFSGKFSKLIADLGVERFGAEGEEFDPERHEAVQDTSTGDEKVLATVLRPGYIMGDRVLRTAMVIIGDR